MGKLRRFSPKILSVVLFLFNQFLVTPFARFLTLALALVPVRIKRKGRMNFFFRFHLAFVVAILQWRESIVILLLLIRPNFYYCSYTCSIFSNFSSATHIKHKNKRCVNFIKIFFFFVMIPSIFPFISLALAYSFIAAFFVSILCSLSHFH